jgi:hypothetical protein
MRRRPWRRSDELEEEGRRECDGWHVVDDDDYRQAVGKPQVEGMMSTAASFSLN